MSERNFQRLERELDQALSNLKNTKDPQLRRELLLEMRLLLLAADRLLFETPERLPATHCDTTCPLNTPA